MLFVCENNGWSEFSRAQDQLRFELTKLAQAYAIDAIQTDGNDVELVASVVEEISGPVRTGFGPAIVECLTTRHSGHFEGDPQRYRDDEDISSSRKDDPVARLRERLFEAGVTAETTRSIEHKVRTEVAEAVATARAESCEDFSVARKQVYAGR